MTPPPEDSSRAPLPRPDLRAVPPQREAVSAAEAETAEGPVRRRRGHTDAPEVPGGPRRRPEPRPDEAPRLVAVPGPQPAAMKPRHWGLIATFVLLVLVPFAASVWYLWARAADQYHSEVAFSIRSEQPGGAAAGLLGALTQIGGGSASDASILDEFIGSQRIVDEIDAELDLRAIYNRAPHDPVFTLGADPTDEALLRQWHRMVEVSYETQGGIIHVRANAFTPGDAQAIARAILAHSGALVNQLSDQAREDAVHFAHTELAESEANLRTQRQRLADFRRENRMVDPAADAAGQSGLLNALQDQLARALVDRDVMLSYADQTDQRVIQVNRRIDAINARVEAERASLDGGGALPDVLGTYQELQVDLEFANKAYLESLAGLTAARAEARRQSRYLAAHIQPTLATSSLYPRRVLLGGLIGLFLLLGWGIAMLVYYNVRDSR